MTRRPIALLAAAVSAAGLTPAAAHAAIATGPGRVMSELGSAQPRPSVDPLGFSAGVVRPDGGTITAAPQPGGRVRLLALKRDGTPDTAFGTGGSQDVRIPIDSGRLETVYQLLRRPDGRLLLVTSGPPVGAPNTLPQIAVTGLTATGAPDPAFNGGQTLETGVLVAGQVPAALAADGGLVLTGAANETHNGPPEDLIRTTWVVKKLTAAGAPDTTFGTVTLPGGGAAGGYAVGVGPTGAIWVLGITDRTYVLRRLLPTGAIDPGFARGGAVPVQGTFGAGLLVRDDGTADVIVTAGNPAAGQLTRVRADGTPDPTFHGGTPATVLPSAELVAGPNGSDLVVAAPFGLSPKGRATIKVQRVAPDGTLALNATAPTGLAGGAGSSFTTTYAPVPTGLNQSNVALTPIGARADGSLVVAGAVATTIGTGEGAGYEHDRGAVVSLTPDGKLDPAFGGTDSAASLRLSVPTQHTGSVTSKRVYGIKLNATTSDIGLIDLKVTAGGRTIAASTAPAFAAGRQTVKALLTKTARTSLRHRHGVKVTVRATFVDLLGHQVVATAHGTLK